MKMMVGACSRAMTKSSRTIRLPGEPGGSQRSPTAQLDIQVQAFANVLLDKLTTRNTDET